MEQKTTFDKGEPYLEVHGVDMDRVPITALRMWMFEEGEIVPGNLYILRGLRVAPDRVWDDAAWKYVPSPDRRKLDCSGRAASVATGSRHALKSWPQAMCVRDLCQVWYTFARCVNRLCR